MRFNKKIHLFFNSILPILCWVLLIMGFDELHIAISTLLSAIIHECGHLLCLYCIGGKYKSLRGVLSGLRLKSASNLSYKDELLLYLSGPLANIIVVFLFGIILKHEEYKSIIITINLATAISNLMPIDGYDGYGIIKTLISMNDNGDYMLNILSFISFSLICFLCFLSLYLMVRYNGGYWIFTVFFISMIKELTKMFKNTNFEI